MRERRHSCQTGFGEKESKRERRPNARVELQRALAPVVRAGEGFVTALGLFFLRRCVPDEDCDGARASLCDAMRGELKTSPRSGAGFQRRPAACRARSHGPQ